MTRSLKPTYCKLHQRVLEKTRVKIVYGFIAGRRQCSPDYLRARGTQFPHTDDAAWAVALCGHRDLVRGWSARIALMHRNEWLKEHCQRGGNTRFGRHVDIIEHVLGIQRKWCCVPKCCVRHPAKRPSNGINANGQSITITTMQDGIEHRIRQINHAVNGSRRVAGFEINCFLAAAPLPLSLPDRDMQYVSSPWGPRVFLPTSDIGRWIDELGTSPTPDIGLYGLACSINEYCRVISPWGTPLFIFGDDPSDIFYFADEYDGLLVRWALRTRFEHLAAFAIAEANTDSWTNGWKLKLSAKR